MSPARIRGPGFGILAQCLGTRAAHRPPGGLVLLFAVAIAIASWLPIERAAAASARSDQIIVFVGRDFSGPMKTWSLKPDQPFLAVPYTGDDFHPVSASIKLGADVGVLLFELPFFSTVDETCDYQLGDAADPALWWRSDKAMFVPGPEERGAVEGNLRAQEIASLILYRRASGPPPGALLLERRRYVNWDCSAPTKARGYRRLFVPVAAPPHRQGCFNLDAGLSYGASGKVALDFSAASELLLIQPHHLTADYARIDHNFTVGLHDDSDCAGTGATFAHPDAGARRFDLKQFNFDRKARSVMLRYDQGAYDGMLLAAHQGSEAAGAPDVAARAETAPEEPPPVTQAETPEEAMAETPEKAMAEPPEEARAEPREEAPLATVTNAAAQASSEPLPEPVPKILDEPIAEPTAEPVAESATESTADSAGLEAPVVTETTGDGEGAADGPDPEGGMIASATDSNEDGESETVAQAAQEAAPESTPESDATSTVSVLGEAEPAAPTGGLAPAGEAVSEAEVPEAGALGSASPEAEISQLEAPETETPQSETNGFLVLPEAEAEAAAAGQSFEFPLLQGYRLNACLYQQEGCGEEAASEWCKARGFAGGAASFELDENIGSLFPTLALGDLQLCANFVCDGFKEITCLP